MILQRRLDEMSGETFDDSCIWMHRFYFSSRVFSSSTFISSKVQVDTENLKCRKEKLLGGPQFQRRMKDKVEV